LPAGPQALADGASQQLMDALPEKYQAALPAYQRLQQMTQPLAALPAAAGNPMLQATQALLPLLNVADPITPMLMAAWTEHCVKAPAVVQLLLDAGAEPAVVNHAGRWPEEEAEQFGFYNLAQQLQHVRQAHRQREARALYCTLIQKQNRDEEFDSSATLAGRVAEFIVDDNPAEQLLHIDAHMLRRHELDQMNPVHRQLVLLRERAAARLSRTWQQAKSSVQELLRKKR